jgi:hypothetical protein
MALGMVTGMATTPQPDISRLQPLRNAPGAARTRSAVSKADPYFPFIMPASVATRGATAGLRRPPHRAGPQRGEPSYEGPPGTKEHPIFGQTVPVGRSPSSTFDDWWREPGLYFPKNKTLAVAPWKSKGFHHEDVATGLLRKLFRGGYLRGPEPAPGYKWDFAAEQFGNPIELAGFRPRPQPMAGTSSNEWLNWNPRGRVEIYSPIRPSGDLLNKLALQFHDVPPAEFFGRGGVGFTPEQRLAIWAARKKARLASRKNRGSGS